MADNETIQENEVIPGLSEDNPVVVEKFSEFLEAVGNTEIIYIKIGKNLNAKEEGYDIFEEPIEIVDYINSEEQHFPKVIFADQKTKIESVTIYSNSMLKFRTGTKITNICFDTWVIKNTTSTFSYLFTIVTDGNVQSEFKNCEMTIETLNRGTTFGLFSVSGAKFYYCSIYIKVFDATNFSIYTNNTQIIKSNFHFYGENSQISSKNIVYTTKYSGIIFEHFRITSTQFTNFCTSGAYSYVVFKNCNLDDDCSVYSSPSSVLLCQDPSPGEDNKKFIEKTLTSPEDLKNESYLQGIGWLP